MALTRGDRSMLGTDLHTGAHDDADDTAAIIAEALFHKFGSDAKQIAQIQASCAGQETRANWLAVVQRLENQPSHPV